MLGDEAEVAGGEVAGEAVAGLVGEEGDVVECAVTAEVFEGLAAWSGAGEDKAKAGVVLEGEHGGGDGVEVVGEAEVAGVEDAEDVGCGLWVVGCGEGGDEGAVGPVLGDVDS